MSKHIYQLHISIKHLKPLVWRRLLVPADTLLPKLHIAIQIAMGWKDEHLHQFVAHGEYFAPPSDDDWDGLPTEDYQDVQLQDVLYEAKESIVYEYDFGDSWEHIVQLEKKIPWQEGNEYPICLAGKNACPLENSGGPYGYMHLLEAVKDTNSSKYQWMLDVTEGLGHKPDVFSEQLREEINKQLRCEDNYLNWDDYV